MNNDAALIAAGWREYLVTWFVRRNRSNRKLTTDPAHGYSRDEVKDLAMRCHRHSVALAYGVPEADVFCTVESVR